jgi:Tfp pilus assembly protein PilN
MKDTGKLLTFLPLILLAIGLIGWTLTLRADVTSTTDKIEVLQEEMEDIHDRLEALEGTVSIIENEQRTIMADHMGFADVLDELGKAGLLPAGERREYGNYGK